MATTAAQLQVIVTADTKGAEEGLNRVGKSAGGASGGIKGLLGNMLGIAGGVGIANLAADAFGFLKDQIGDTVKAAEAHQQAMAQTMAVLKSTGDASGQTASSISALAEQFSTLTPFSRDATEQAENMLLTFTNLKGDTFPSATKATLDFAQAMHMDATSAALQLGKALNDPATGLTKLQREGVTFTQAQKEQIIAMEKYGDVAGAQALMLKELEKEFGGSAQAAGNTFAGALQIAQNQLEDTKEKVGTALLPVLSQLLKALTPLISALSDGLGQILPQIASAFSQDLVPAIQPLLDQLPNLWSLVEGIGQTFLGFATAVGKVGSGVARDVAPALHTLGQWFVQTGLPVVRQFTSFLAQNVLPIFASVVSVVIKDLVPAVTSVANTVIKQVLPALEGLWNELAPKLLPIFQVVAGVLSAVLPVALNLVANAVALLANGISFLVGLVGGFFRILGGAASVAGGVISELGKIASFVTGTFQGAFTAVGSVISGIFNGLVGIIKAPINLIIGGLNILIDGLDHIHFQVPDWVPLIGGKGFGFSIPEIPKLATGAVDFPGGPALIGEGNSPELVVGPTVANIARGSNVIPLPNGLPGLATASQGGQQVPIIIQVDGRMLAQVTAKHMPQVIRQATGARSF